MADRAGAFIDACAGGRGSNHPSAGETFEFDGQRVLVGLTDRRVVEGTEIDRHGPDVLVGQSGEFFHHRRHRAGGDAVEAGFAGAQIREQLVLAPGDRRMRQRGQRRRLPAFGEPACQIGVRLLSAERVAR